MDLLVAPHQSFVINSVRVFENSTERISLDLLPGKVFCAGANRIKLIQDHDLANAPLTGAHRVLKLRAIHIDYIGLVDQVWVLLESLFGKCLDLLIDL